MLINRRPQFQSYVRDAVKAGRVPALMVIRVRSGAIDDDGRQLLHWLGTQALLLGPVPLVTVGPPFPASAVPRSARVASEDTASLESVVNSLLTSTPTLAQP